MAQDLKDVLAQLKKANPILEGKGKEGIHLSGKEIKRYTDTVKKLGKEWHKAVSEKDIKTINNLAKSFGQLKVIELNNKRLKELRSRMDAFAEASKTATDPKDVARYTKHIVTLSEKIEALNTETAEVSQAFTKLNRSFSGRLADDLKELAISKWTGFASLATAAGLAGKTFQNFDRASNLASESLSNLPLDQTNKKFIDYAKSVDGSSSSLGIATDQLFLAKKAHSIHSQEIDNAVQLNKEFTQTAIMMGKSVEDVGTTGREVMNVFRLNLQSNTEEIGKTTQAVELLGKATGMGAGDAIEKFRMRTQDMGTSLVDAQNEMSGLVASVEELRKGYPNLTMSTKQYSDLVYDAVTADTRHSQNMRLKNQLIQNTIDLMLKQGKTQKEAEEAAKAMVEGTSKASEVIKNTVGMDLAGQFKTAYEGGAEAQAAFIKDATKAMDPEAAKKMATQLTEEFARAAKSGGVHDLVSQGAILEDMIGSQQKGLEAQMSAYQKIYGSIKDTTTMTKVIASHEHMSLQAARLRADQIQAMNNGMTAAEAAQGALNEGQAKQLKTAEDQKAIEEDTTAELKGRAIEQKATRGWWEQASDTAKTLLSDPRVTAIGAVAAVAAYAANTMALWANTAALAKGGGATMAGEALGAVKGGAGKLAGLASSGASGFAALGGGGAMGAATAGAGVAAAGVAGYAAGKVIDMGATYALDKMGVKGGIGGGLYDLFNGASDQKEMDDATSDEAIQKKRRQMRSVWGANAAGQKAPTVGTTAPATVMPGVPGAAPGTQTGPGAAAPGAGAAGGPGMAEFLGIDGSGNVNIMAKLLVPAAAFAGGQRSAAAGSNR
jgi:hypothetical protein